MMRSSVKVVLLFSLVVMACCVLGPGETYGQDKRWAYFSFDKNKEGTRYYYDTETVSYLSDNRVSVWLKIASPEGEELIQTEIECTGSMFRTVQPYKPLFEKPDKTSYAAYGWLKIPPDSEVYLLKKIVCKPRD